jgi:hypothetical protein
MSARSTKLSLAAGVVAAPLFAVVALAQAFTRDGYDLTRHPVSMLANGDLGWIQISSFVLTGLLAILAARAMPTAWSARLQVVIGAGMLIAAAFRMDPGDGFPVGTPLGAPTTMTWHAVVHNVGGSLSFFSMIALCFVLARAFAADGRAAWARTGRIAAIAFAALMLWAMTGGRGGALTLFVGVLLAWGWIAASSGIIMARTYGSGRGSARMFPARAATMLDA